MNTDSLGLWFTWFGIVVLAALCALVFAVVRTSGARDVRKGSVTVIAGVSILLIALGVVLMY